MKKKVAAVFFVFVSSLCLIPFFSGCASAELRYVLSESGDHYYVCSSRTNLTDEQFAEMCPYYSEELGPVNEPLEGTLPVTEIGTRGFLSCRKLKSIVIPDFISTIGASAFAYCTGLKSVTFPNNGDFKTIPYGIFGEDSCLLHIDIPESVERIESYAFYVSYLTEIVIPSTVTYMGFGVFDRCEKLQKAEIYAEIDALPYGTFCSCSKLQEVRLSSSIKEIKGYEYLNGNGEVISEDEIIQYVYGGDNDTEDPNYVDNVTETVPAFYYTAIDAGSSTITFDYYLERLYYLGTEEELNRVVVGEYNVCLTESPDLVVYCLENDEWKEVNWNF